MLYVAIHIIYLIISIPISSTFSNDLTFNIECIYDDDYYRYKTKKTLKGIFVWA